MQEKSRPIYRINDFFELYAKAVENHDSKFLTNCHSLPCTFIADDSSLAYTSAAKLEGLINNSKRFYSVHGIVSAIPDIRSKRFITDRIVQVSMTWKYFNAKNKPVYDCDYQYLLKLNEYDEWKIEVAISINEQEKIKQLGAGS